VRPDDQNPPEKGLYFLFCTNYLPQSQNNLRY
jgi:hypothetical protein